MAESATPICDLIRSLMSRGLSPGQAIEEAAKTEAVLAYAMSGKALEAKRKMERERKQKWRAKTVANVPGTVPGTKSEYISSNNSRSVFTKEMKKESKILHSDVPGTAGELFESPSVEKPKGDWPKNYRDVFWATYPKRCGKAAAMKKLEAIAKAGKVPWVTFTAGVGAYVKHVAGTEDRFIKHPVTWLNQGCWDDEHKANGGYNGKVGGRYEGLSFAGLAATVRYGAKQARDSDAASGEGLAGGRGDSEDRDERMARDRQAALPAPRSQRR
jgi:hypothetical protein